MSFPHFDPSSKHDRRVLAQKTARTWRQMVTWILAPLLIGIAGVSMANISTVCYEINRWISSYLGWGAVIYMPVGYALLIFVSRRFFPGTQGSGIPQAIAVLEDHDGTKKSNLLSVRIVIGRILLLIGGLVIGASIGHEGPMVQIGGSIMHIFFGYGTLKRAEHRQMLVLAGGAAGIAATFNTPIGGIMFAMEEMAKKYVYRGHNQTIFTVLMSGLVSLVIMGSYTYFGKYHVELDFVTHIPAILVCGVVGGLFGGVFSLLAQKTPDGLPERLRRILTHHPMAFAAVCGLLMACLSLATDGLVNGTGYVPTKMALENDTATHVWFYGPAKFAGTLLSALCGLPGGLFAPTLAVGGGLGDMVSHVLPDIAPHRALIILVMVAYLSGLTQSPLTAFVISMEITGSYELLMPMIAVSLIANFVSKVVCPASFYHKLALRFEKPAVTGEEKENRKDGKAVDAGKPLTGASHPEGMPAGNTDTGRDNPVQRQEEPVKDTGQAGRSPPD